MPSCSAKIEVVRIISAMPSRGSSRRPVAAARPVASAAVTSGASICLESPCAAPTIGERTPGGKGSARDRCSHI